MASYDTDVLTAVECAQYTGANLADIQAICRDAREDPTMEKVVKVPIGGSHGQVRTMYVGDWITSVATGEFVVLPNTSFLALFSATP